jgi:hypothetical protein
MEEDTVKQREMTATANFFIIIVIMVPKVSGFDSYQPAIM